MSDIITGVDKLMSIVKEKHKVSVQAMSIQLNVPRSLILEWANMLEDDGTVEIQEKFMHTYLVWKKAPKHDKIYHKIMRPSGKTLITFEHKFMDFKKQITHLISGMEKELNELKKIEMQNQDIARRGFNEVDKKLDDEKKILNLFQKELLHDEKQIDTEASVMQSLQKAEDKIEQKLNAIENKISPQSNEQQIKQQMELYREKIRNLNYQRSIGFGKQDLTKIETEIEKYKKAYYGLAAHLK